MANTFNADLINEVLSQTAITKVQDKLALLSQFTTDFSTEVRDMRSKTVHVPYASTGSAVVTDATDFEVGDTTLGDAKITLNHYSKSFYITQSDYENGHRLENLARLNLNLLTSKIESLVFALMTTTNYGAAVVSGITAGAFSVANLQTLWGSIPGNTKIAILKDTEFKNLLASNMEGFDIRGTKRGYGFDFLDNSGAGFASAGTKVVGFGGNPAAIVMAAAVPAKTPQVAELVSSSVMVVPEIGLPIEINLWASSKTRQTWASYDVLFGCAVGDGGAGKLVATA